MFIVVNNHLHLVDLFNFSKHALCKLNSIAGKILFLPESNIQFCLHTNVIFYNICNLYLIYHSQTIQEDSLQEDPKQLKEHLFLNPTRKFELIRECLSQN